LALLNKKVENSYLRTIAALSSMTSPKLRLEKNSTSAKNVRLKTSLDAKHLPSQKTLAKIFKDAHVLTGDPTAAPEDQSE